MDKLIEAKEGMAEFYKSSKAERNANNAQMIDDAAVDKFAAAMKEKMAKQRAKGYSGWYDLSQCPTERLQSLLVSHIEKGDPVDVGNFAMMLFNRGEATAQQPAQEPVKYKLVPLEPTKAMLEAAWEYHASNQYATPRPDAETDAECYRAMIAAAPKHAMEAATDGLAKWLSAALDDPNVCAEYKRDINTWFAAQAQQPAQEPAAPVQEPITKALIELLELWYRTRESGCLPLEVVRAHMALRVQQPVKQESKPEYTFDELTKLVMQAATKEGHKVTMKIKWAQTPVEVKE